MDASVRVVVVNWNTGDYLRACLGALPAAVDEADIEEITVVDNGSTDASDEDLCAGTIPVRLLRNEVNAGFARACNQGAADATADFLLFLNPDARPLAGAITAVRRHLDNSPDVGICGASIVGESGQPGIAAARFPTIRVLLGKATGLDRLAPQLFPSHHLRSDEIAATGDVDQVIGAFLMIRRTLFEALGGFDERFFLYFDDVDLALRARQRGARSVVVGEAEVVHAAGQSSSLVRDQRVYHSVRSRMLYARKHWRAGQVVAALAVTLAVELPIRVLASFVRRGPGAGSLIAAYVRGTWHGFGAPSDVRLRRPIELPSAHSCERVS